jgi:hypothetical protein
MCEGAQSEFGLEVVGDLFPGRRPAVAVFPDQDQRMVVSTKILKGFIVIFFSIGDCMQFLQDASVLGLSSCMYCVWRRLYFLYWLYE